MELKEKQRQFAREYRPLFDFLYRYVRYRVPSAEDAEDVVSDVFAQAYARLDGYEPLLGTLRQWTCGIARHAIGTHWRTRRASVSLDAVAETVPELAVPSDADGVDHRLRVERALRGLPSDAKALLAMRYEDGMTHAQIAEAIGKDPAAVRKFFSRLLSALRLANEEYPYDQ